MQKIMHPLLIAAAAFFISLAGCSNRNDQMDTADGNRTMASSDSMQKSSDMDNTRGIAVIHPTSGNDVTGKISFIQDNGGLHVYADVSGLPEGAHGFHIHLYGDCSADDGTSAGTHFNFEGSSKNPPADIDRITGNLGNLMAGSNDTATADTTISNASLSGSKSVLGRAMIIHAKANNPSQPPIGAAGARLGCGVIGHANPKSVSMNNRNSNQMNDNSMNH